QEEKDTFKTAFEIDQRWLIELAADRSPFICQAQSLNVFLPADVHKRDLHQIHYQAWKKGVKSLYYCRSKSIQRAEASNDSAGKSEAAVLPVLGKVNGEDLPLAAAENARPMSTDYEECLACQ
ncbi:MAG: ribonucleotide-diphosphate reductase subunit alpha, partial [Pseudomonadota bacterium]